jgi:uncharacterized protein (TIGR02145 family)
MPDGKIWFAQNLNYTKDLTYNAYSYEANGVPAIGSYWCPAVPGVVSGDAAACNVYGALYTWETAMMVDGKYADNTKSSMAWDESWVSSNTFTTGAPGSTANAKKNNARGGTGNGGGRGICPMGWHVPTDYEWANMLDKVEGNTTFTVSQTATGWWGSTVKATGSKMKSAATYTGADPGDGSWLEHAYRGTNSTNFSALPAGHREPTGYVLYWRGIGNRIWSSSVVSGSAAWSRNFQYSEVLLERLNFDRAFGFAVRCIKD